MQGIGTTGPQRLIKISFIMTSVLPYPIVGELDHLVPERVWAEMEKAMREPFPGDFFVPLADIGALKVLMPELDYGVITDANLTRASQLPSKGRFAALLVDLTADNIKSLLDRLKAPSDVRQLAVRTRRLVTLLCSDLTPERVVSTLEKMGTFQDDRDTLGALQVCDTLVLNHLSGFTDRLCQVRTLVWSLRDVCFASLTENQQETLKGPEIGAALRELRLQLVRTP